MDSHFSRLIDWSQSWFMPWRVPGEAIAAAALAGGDLPAALNAAALAPRRFIAQAELPEGVAYESHIFVTGGVPTREGLHDFFNALCWMRFPATKLVLNRLQAHAIEAAGGVQGRRGPLRDALTLFDENAALLQAPDPIWQALLARDWRRLFVELRPLWADATLLLFGHALSEKLVSPYKSITAHVLKLPIPLDLPSDSLAVRSTGSTIHPWDDWLAAELSPEWLATKPFTPLPVLGMPGWWPANEAADFYADAQVFRPARQCAAMTPERPGMPA